MYSRYKRIDRRLYDWCVRHKLVDAPLIAKWKKPGYERLCSTYVINPKNFNYGSTSICRVPRQKLAADGRVIVGNDTGCLGCASGAGGFHNIFGNKYGQSLADIQMCRERGLLRDMGKWSEEDARAELEARGGGGGKKQNRLELLALEPNGEVWATDEEEKEMLRAKKGLPSAAELAKEEEEEAEAEAEAQKRAHEAASAAGAGAGAASAGPAATPSFAPARPPPGYHGGPPPPGYQGGPPPGYYGGPPPPGYPGGPPPFYPGGPPPPGFFGGPPPGYPGAPLDPTTGMPQKWQWQHLQGRQPAAAAAAAGPAPTMGGYSAIMRAKQASEREAAEEAAREAAEAAEDEAAATAEAAANAAKAEAATADQAAASKRPRDGEEPAEGTTGAAEDSEAKRSKLAVDAE